MGDNSEERTIEGFIVGAVIGVCLWIGIIGLTLSLIR